MYEIGETFFGGKIVNDKNIHIKVEITPEIAMNMLAENINNRNIRPRKVKMFVEDIKNGRWREGDPNALIFNCNHVLKDGQHRLTAIVKSGMTVTMPVTICADETVRNIDRQSRRTLVDTIFMDSGKKTNNPLLGGIRMWLFYKKNNFDDSRTDWNSSYLISDEEIMDEFYTNEKWKSLVEIMGTSQRSLSSRSYVYTAAMAAIYCGVKLETISDFVKVLNTGTTSSGASLEEISSAIFARNYLLKAKAEKRNHSTIAEGKIEEYIYRFANKTEVKKGLSNPTWVYCKRLNLIKEWRTL